VVTSAAVIMVAVFSIFAALHLVELKMLGIGLPVAVLIDATVVRGILVPAAMTLLGDRCWYLPRWLSWLPGRPLDAPANDPRQPGRTEQTLHPSASPSSRRPTYPQRP
jgi:RND superfamily putative drug exporter